MKQSLIILIGVLVVILVAFGGTYNSLVNKSENVDKELANIDVQLTRRADLIPNLVNTVKGYTQHETAAIELVTKARENLVKANTVEEKSKANNELTTALNGLMVVVENYPDLKASVNFTQLQDELAGTENRISTARRDYNDAVTSYNSAVKRFPTNIIANMMNFDKKAYFEADEKATQVPEVNF